MIFPDTYYPYPMGLPNFCYHLAIKKMAINGKIRLVSLVVYNYILPRKTGKYNNLPRCGVSSDLTLIIDFIRTPPTFIRTCTDEYGNPIP